MGANAEIKTLESGNSVTSFNLAVKNRDKTLWVRIVAWNKTAELLNKYTKKGDMIGVNGRLDVREYEVDGNKRTAYEVVAEQIHFCGGSKKDENNNNNNNSTEQTELKEVSFLDEDLPF